MPYTVQGVIARGKGEPVSLETIVVPDPGPGEAVVNVQACGVCHTDLHYREGGINDDFPFLLGHEAAGVVEAVGDGRHRGGAGRLRDPELAGGLRRLPRLPPRASVVLLQHPQRHPEDDPGGRHRALPGPRHRRLRREDPGRGRSVHQGDPAARRDGGGPARLRRDGGHRRGHQHRRRDPGRHGRRHRLRRRRRRGHRRRLGWPGASKIIAVDVDDRKLAWAKEFGATHTVNSPNHRRGRGDQGAHRRQRRGRGDRGGRPPGDLQAGLLRPRPGRNRGPGRRAHPGDDAGAAAAGRLRPRRLPEVLLVRRLPAQP